MLDKVRKITFLFVPLMMFTACGQQSNLSIPEIQTVNINDVENNLSSQEILANLKKAANGLLMPSESDYPFKTFIWKEISINKLSKEQLLKLTNHKTNTVIEERKIEEFFKNLIVEQSWHSAQEKENVKKFRNLLNVIKTNLKNIKVYRLGSVDIDVYITGQAGSDILGLSTKVIETRK